MSKPTRTCLDCRQPSNDFEWCDICKGNVCFYCDDLHDCTGELQEPAGPYDDLDPDWLDLFKPKKKKPGHYDA